MKKFVNVVVLVGLTSIASGALAQWNVSVGYSQFGSSSIGVAYGSAGYKYEFGKITILPELRLGVGTGNDNTEALIDGEITDFTVEVDSLIAASVRAQFNVTKHFGIFLQPSYSRIDQVIKGDQVAFSTSSDFSDFDVGVGAAFNFNEQISVEAFWNGSSYSSNMTSVGIRYAF